jgi:hypothetical protein
MWMPWPRRKLSVRRWCLTIWFTIFAGVFALAGTAATAAPEDYRVAALPGLSAQPDFSHYAGYLPASKDAGDKIFFWLMQSQSDPARDPLLIWLSGGPGCSSIAAQFEENGPFTLKDGGVLGLNPYGWNNRANLLYIDQPLQTGLSFSGDGRYQSNQRQGTDSFVTFLVNFYEAFPEYKGRPLYLSGESYAGHFIPAIAAELLSNPQAEAAGIRLAGLAIGNGWVDPYTHITSAPAVAQAAGVITAAQRESFEALLGKAIGAGAPRAGNFGTEGTSSPPALDVAGMMDPFKGIVVPAALAGNAQAVALKALFDPYVGKVIAFDFSNRDFISAIDILASGPPELRDLLPPVIKVQFQGKTNAQLIYDYLIARIVASTADAGGGSVNLMDLQNYGPVSMIGTPTAWPSGDAEFEKYMSRPDVLSALHASEFGKRPFMACNPLTYFNLSGDYFESAVHYLPGILSQIPVLFYNGQDDLIVSSASTQALLNRLAADPHAGNWPGKQDFVAAAYVPWTLDGNRAGYLQAAGNLHFLNVLRASHMVPLSVPRAAQVLIGRFVHGEPAASAAPAP